MAAGVAYHEEAPDFAVVIPADPCILTGLIAPTPRVGGGPQHFPAVPNADPAHTHFFLIDNVAHCAIAGPLAVIADGGNDGHIDDIDGMNPLMPFGPNGDPVEDDPVDDQVPGDVDFTLGGGNPDGDDHEYNDHHGSVPESGWSNSDGYSAGRDDANGIRGEWNDPQAMFPQPGGSTCSAIGSAPHDVGANQNRSDIVANGSAGWLKYVRSGAVAYVWGCFFSGPLSYQSGHPNPYFSGFVVIGPNPMFPAANALWGLIHLGPGWVFDGVTFGNS